MKGLFGIAIAIVAAACLLTTSGQARHQSGRQDLVGVWDLVSLQDHRSNGDVLDWMGKKPSGMLIYSRDGRMSIQIMRDPRPEVAGPMWSSDGHHLLPNASASEIRDSYSGYYAYFGRWDVDESAHTVTHHVRASLRPGEVESAYVRPFEISGAVLRLRYPVNADDGELRTRLLVWQRAEHF